MRFWVPLAASAALWPACSTDWSVDGRAEASQSHAYAVAHTDAEWKKLLTPMQYEVLRKKGTEMAFSGAYYKSHEKAVYRCAACSWELFSSEQKFDSGTGWPSFWAPLNAQSVETASDGSYGMVRTEVRCAHCGGHLGHVFDDGPAPTGKRYCINSAALKQELKK